MFYTLFSITGIVIVSKLFGFVKQMVIANAFGADIETDLISLSEGFVSDVQYALVQALITAFVAIYIHTKEKDEAECRQFVADTIWTSLCISLMISAGIFAFSPQIAHIIAPSYTEELLTRLATYIRLFSPLFILFVVRAIFHGILNANERFIPGELTVLNQSLITIFIIFLFGGKWGVQTLAISLFVCVIWNTCFLSICSYKYCSLEKGTPFKNRNIHQMIKMMGPLLLGHSMIFVNQQVDKIIVSGFEAGTVTALHYGTSLSQLITTLIVSLTTVLFTKITMFISQANKKGAAQLTTAAAVIMAVIFLPISIVTVMCAEDIVRIAFERGAFDQKAIHSAALALKGYGFCFVPYALKSLFSRFQYGVQKTKAPMINSVIGILCNIVLSIILSRPFGIFGVAFASSISELLCGCFNIVTAKRCNEFLKFKFSFSFFIRWVIGGIVCAGLVLLGNVWWSGCPVLLRFVLITLCSIGGYFIFLGSYLYRQIKNIKA